MLQLEVRQRQMEKLVALGQLAAGVAHEINNPLAGMRNAFELIKRSLPREHEHFELLGLIDKEIDRISGITHQMYQLYKRTPQQPCKFDIAQTVSEVLFMLENTADKQKIRLIFDPQQKPVRINLVEGEVKQILYNLIRNAIQASPVVRKSLCGSAMMTGRLRYSLRIEDPAFPTKSCHAFSIPFSAPNRLTRKLEWGWDCPSRGALSRPWEDGSK